MNRTLLGAAAALLILTSPSHAGAGVTRSCSPDAVANTAAILCAPPSGPCDLTSVVVGASITLTNGPCHFDLEGRSLRIDRTLQVRISADQLDNTLTIDAAGDVVLGRGSRLKARGDFRALDGQFTYGGFIQINSTGAVRVAGLIDVSGDSGGGIEIHAGGDLVVEPRAKIRGNGRTKFADMGVQYTDGGYLVAESLAANVSFAGQVQLRGSSGGTGGSMDIVATRDIDLTGKIDLTGGGFGGGDIGIDAHHDLRISRAKIDARSRGGGQDGGFILLFAGSPYTTDGTPVAGAAAVGNLTIERTVFITDGSANDIGTSGSGGDVVALAYGNIAVSDVTIRANGASSPENPDGYGGEVSFDAVPVGDYRDPLGYSSPFDLFVSGHISARGGGPDGLGGRVFLSAPRHLVDAATLDIGGRYYAGDVGMVAGGDLEIRKPINSAVDSATGNGGIIEVAAGAEGVGKLTIASDLRGGGGTRNAVGPTIDLRGCPVQVADGVTIDASSGFGAAGDPGTPTIALASGRPIELGDGSRYLAGPAGSITASHPPTLGPIVGAGVSFDPPLLDIVVPSSAFRTCPRCGNGPGDDCGPQVRIDDITPGADAIAATVAIESPLGLPLSGTVAVCDGAGVEDVTFTWLARTFNPHDVFELLVNDTVVAEVPPESGSAECPHGPESYTVPIADVAPLLTAGVNRFGVRTSAVGAGEGCRVLAWAYATVTSGGVATRVPIFDYLSALAPLGSDSFAVTDACLFTNGCAAIDASTPAVLCGVAASASWTGVLPCGLDLAGLATDHDYSLLVRATDGVVAEPAFAVGSFARTTQNGLTINGATCP